MAIPMLKRLEIAVRLASPDGLRRLYRILRSSVHAPVLSQPIPEHLVRDCRVCSSRYSMLERLPKGGAVIEVGTLRGEFAAQILARCAPERLHIVDIDLSRVHPTVLKNAAVVPHESLTLDAVAAFDDESLDWIYIDAAHDYQSVLADARAYAPKLKPGGFLVFNDFAHIDPNLGRYGVHRAVVDFCIEQDWPMAFLALEPSGLYDVALQRPDAGAASAV